MWEEYAKARGVATTSLTQAQKVEAEYQGIMKETTAQVGDLEKLSGGLAGAQAKATMQSELLARAYGDAMTPAVGLGAQLETGVLSMLTGIATAAPEATAGLTAATGAMTAMTASAAGLATVKKLMEGIGIAGKTLGVFGKIALVVGLLTAAYSALQKAAAKATEEEAARVQANKDALAEQKGRVSRLDELMARYRELSQQSMLSSGDSQEMLAIQKELAEAFGITANNVNGLAAAYENLAEQAEGARQKELIEAYNAQSTVTYDAQEKARKGWEDSAGAMQKYIEALTILSNEKANYAAGMGMDTADVKDDANWAVIAAKKAVDDARAELNKPENSGLFADWYANEIDLITVGAERDTGKINEAFAASLKSALTDSFSLEGFAEGGFEGMEAFVDANMQSLLATLTDADMGDAFTVLNDAVQAGMTGAFTPDEATRIQIAEAWETLTGEGSPLRAMAEQFAEAMGGGEEYANAFLSALNPMMQFGETANTATTALQGISDATVASTDSVAELAKAYGWASGSMEQNTQRGKDLLNAYKSLTQQIDRVSKESSVLEKGQKALNKAKKDSTKLSSQEQDDLKAVSKLLGYQGSDYGVLQGKLTQYANTLQSELETAQGSLQSLTGEMLNASACANIDGSVQVDCASAYNNMSGLMQSALALLSVLQALGIAGNGTSGGGGGGGGGKDKAEEARKAAEDARRKAIEDDYALMDHQRHMNEITLQQYIAMLEQMYSKHRLNNDELMELDEKLYDARQELMDEHAEKLDTMGDAVVTALENRYEAMRDAELKRLDDSRAAWESWRDDSVAAIEDQIAALDKLADTEDREAKDAEELRKIEKLRRDVEYEQDTYNRQKLQQQLEAAMQSREERLRKQSIQDQKAALQQEIDAINDRANAALDSLDKEQESVESVYEERLKQAALEAEAQKALTQSTQTEILALLRDFAPDYNLTGKTLGEKLLEGFKSKAIGIASWFESLGASMEAVQMQAAQTAIDAASSFYAKQQNKAAGAGGVSGVSGVNITQQNTFMHPVETPSETARRIRLANEELAEELLRSM